MASNGEDIRFLWDERGEPGTEEIEQENARMRKRHADFRRAAEYVARELSHLPPVRRVALFGSVASPLEKEIPPAKRYSRAGIKIFHECRDVDLAVWTQELGVLDSLRRARVDALRKLHDEQGIGVAHHQIDVFLFDAGDRYAGRLCIFGKCPRGKFVCKVPGCGRPPFLQQHQGFAFQQDRIAGGLLVELFRR